MIFTAIKSLAKHTAIYSVGELLGRAINVLLLPLYLRRLSTEEMGVQTLAFVFVAFSAAFYSLGLNQALVRRLSGKDDPAVYRSAFSSVFWTLLGIALVLSALMWMGAKPLARIFLDAEAYKDIFQLLAVIIFLDTLSEPLFTLCRTRQRSATYTIARFLQYSLQMGLTVYLIVGLGHGVRAIFWSNVASSAFAFLMLLPVCLRNLRPVYAWGAVRQLLAFGLPFVPSALAALVISLSDRFLVKFYLHIEAVGIYEAVYKFGLPMNLFIRAFRSAWAPALLAIPDAEEARTVCARVTTYFAAGAVLFFLCVSVFSRELIMLAAGSNASDYLSGQGVIPLIILSYALYGIYVILTAGVYAEGRAKILPVIVGAGAGANIGMNLFLIPRIGFIAAAWSSLAAYGLMALLLYLSARRFYPVPYEYKRLAKIGVAGAVVFLSASNYAHDTTPAGTVTRGIFLLGYPLLLWGWHFFEPQEWQYLRTVLRLSRRRSSKS